MIEYKKRETSMAREILPWPECYYAAAEPQERRKLLEEHMAEGADPEEDAILLRLYRLRYGEEKPSRGDVTVDRFMRAWMEMTISAENGPGFFGTGRMAKKWKRYMEDFGITGFSCETSREKELRRAEWKAFFARYIEISRNDRTYSGGVLGFGRLKPEDVAKKLAHDLETNTAAFPASLGLAEEFEEFHQCAAEVYEKIVN